MPMTVSPAKCSRVLGNTRWLMVGDRTRGSGFTLGGSRHDAAWSPEHAPEPEPEVLSEPARASIHHSPTALRPDHQPEPSLQMVVVEPPTIIRRQPWSSRSAAKTAKTGSSAELLARRPLVNSRPSPEDATRQRHAR